MSLHSQKCPQISCAEFEASFDQYVDDMLEPLMAEACSRHLANCPPCDREVTRWQQTRILLSTAVADFSTAVDVSSVRNDVMSALGFAEDASTERLRGPMSEPTREASHERGANARRSGGRSGRRAAASTRRSGFAAAWRFASAATVSAATAAAAVLLLTPAPNSTTSTRNIVASAVTAPSRASVRPAAFVPWSKNLFDETAPVAYSPPPLARPKVSNVDGLEAAPGQLVSTWVQPRTNARVIWVQDRGVGAPVRTAGLRK